MSDHDGVEQVITMVWRAQQSYGGPQSSSINHFRKKKSACNDSDR
jgi:hypothetical protein